MVFSSQIFLFYFLPIALAIYYLLPNRARHVGLSLVSYVFYGWANPAFVVLMLGSTLIDFVCGLVISENFGQRGLLPERLAVGGPRTRSQKRALAVSIVSNLSLLAFFKYFNFGVDSYNALMSAIGQDPLRWEGFFRIALPLGISFYTFQSMSYSIDVYRGEARAIRKFGDFACYVSMFPQLVAGPIVRFREIADQLTQREHSFEKFARGVAFFSLGLAKKVLLANPCGKIADTCFGAGALSALDAWLGALAYSFQIYFDFSGYSDMAIGLGLFFGFVFPKNFDSPYKSQSVTEAWTRWHVSLSTWLREYLYIPLGGNRKGDSRTYVNLMLVMLIGGLWHGAAWNFVIWGGIHGVALALERMRGKISIYGRMPAGLRIGFTYLIFVIAFVFFRAVDLPSALAYVQNMLGAGPSIAGMQLVGGLIYQPYYVASLFLAAFIAFAMPQTWDFTRSLTWPRAAWCMAMLCTSILVLSTQAFNPFIYFIF